MEREEYLREERSIDELRSVIEAIVRDIMRETKRDMDATIKEVLDKYLWQDTEMYNTASYS